jgi:hypothetical protein
MGQLVDPFIPVKRDRPLTGQYGQQYFKKTPSAEVPRVTPPPKLDQRTALKPTPAPKLNQTTVPVIGHRLSREIERPRISRNIIPPKHEAVAQTPKPQSKPIQHAKRSPIRKLHIPLILISAVGVGLFLQSQTSGEVIIAIYAVYAVIKHVSSRITFILALVALISVALLSAVQADSTMTDNFAVYAFLLLVVGTICMGLELRHERASQL